MSKIISLERYFCQNLMVFFLLILRTATLNAQINQDTLNFRHIRSGMSQNTATEIFEDSQGFLWIGTVNGLNKYDGTDFELFDKSSDGETGLTNGFIESIYEDKDQNLYIGTAKGLSFYDRKLGLVRPYAFGPNSIEIQSLPISTIIRKAELLFLGTRNYGLYRYNIVTGETKHIVFDEPKKGEPNNNDIIEIFELRNNRFFVVTRGFKYIIDHDLQIKERFYTEHFTMSVAKIGPSKFMFGSEKGDLLGYNIIENQLVRFDSIGVFPGQTITALEQDPNGNFWMGIENHGLSIYSAKSKTVSNFRPSYRKPKSISGNTIRSFFAKLLMAPCG